MASVKINIDGFLYGSSASLDHFSKNLYELKKIKFPNNFNTSLNSLFYTMSDIEAIRQSLDLEESNLTTHTGHASARFVFIDRMVYHNNFNLSLTFKDFVVLGRNIRITSSDRIDHTTYILFKSHVYLTEFTSHSKSKTQFPQIQAGGIQLANSVDDPVIMEINQARWAIDDASVTYNV